MNKRIRKKKHVGEFKELAFSLDATYEKLTPEDADKMLEKILDMSEELDLVCDGLIDLDHFGFYVLAGRINTGEAERKQKLIDFLRGLPGMKEVKAGEFVDPWYTPIEHEHDEECCCCGHSHE